MSPASNRLSIQAGLYGLSYLLEKDGEQNFEQIAFKVSSPAAIENHLRPVLDDLFRNNTIEQVRIFHHNPWNVWVPQAFFDEKQPEKYLQTQIRLFDSDKAAWDVFDEAELVNVYLPMVNLNNILLDYIPEIDFYHSAGLLQNYAWEFPKDLKKRIMVRCSAGDFQLGIWQGKRLKFFNTFRMEDVNDFLYYFFFVWEKNQLEQAKPDIIITGTDSQKMYDELKSFSDNVKNPDLEQSLLKFD